MPRVHVHAAIWVDGKLVVHRHSHRGVERLSLPGGRVKDRESVIDALRREAREEIGREIAIGDLLIAGEVNSTASRAVVLVFAASLRQPELAGSPLHLISADGSEAAQVLPPVIDELRACHQDARQRWLGQLRVPQPTHPARRKRVTPVSDRA
jgi:ADP-ribose pyrophosphatase YjhB (NUDIX family)